MATILELVRGFDNDLKKMQELLQSRRFDEGLALARKYDGLFPKDIELPLLHGRIAYAMDDFVTAEALFARTLAIDPQHNSAATYHAACLSRLGRRQEAIAALKSAYEADPHSTLTLDFYAPLVLVEHGLGPAIALVKAAYEQRGPYNKPESSIEVLRQKALSLFDIDVIRQADPDNFLRLDAVAKPGVYSLRSIYERFEPLGCNCEVGSVQRRHGAEPLALLRWTGVTADSLLRLLRCNLEGYERPEIYSLRGKPETEYLLHDSLFDTTTHTGANLSDMPPEAFLVRVTRRQLFLKRKFLADAAEGQKTFVYKADRLLSDAEIDAIETELRRLGVRKCLFAMLSPDRAKAGTIDIVSPTRVLGYLSTVQPDIRFDEWDRIAVAVHDYFAAQEGAA